MVDGPDLAARIATAIEHAPVRLAIDGVGGEPARQLIDLLAPGGTLVRYSGSDFDPDAAARKGITSDYLLVGYAARTWRHKRSAARGDLAESDLALRQRTVSLHPVRPGRLLDIAMSDGAILSVDGKQPPSSLRLHGPNMDAEVPLAGTC